MLQLNKILILIFENFCNSLFSFFYHKHLDVQIYFERKEEGLFQLSILVGEEIVCAYPIYGFSMTRVSLEKDLSSMKDSLDTMLVKIRLIKESAQKSLSKNQSKILYG